MKKIGSIQPVMCICGCFQRVMEIMRFSPKAQHFSLKLFKCHKHSGYGYVDVIKISDILWLKLITTTIRRNSTNNNKSSSIMSCLLFLFSAHSPNIFCCFTIHSDLNLAPDESLSTREIDSFSFHSEFWLNENKVPWKHKEDSKKKFKFFFVLNRKNEAQYSHTY